MRLDVWLPSVRFRKTASIVLDIMGPMQRVGLAVIGALTAGWLTVSAQVPQPFPGRPNPPVRRRRRHSDAAAVRRLRPPASRPSAAEDAVPSEVDARISCLSERAVHCVVRRRARAAVLPVRQRPAVCGPREVLPERAEEQRHACVRRARRRTCSRSAASARRRWRFRRG